MKLTYSILWFDDEKEYLDSLDLDRIKDEIASWGFIPNIVLVSTTKEFMEYSPFKTFDLIAVDYNLEACAEHGENFIRKLREHDVYTEVVFYSASEISNLWDAIKEKKLEGVFVASRTNGGVLTKIIKVAKQSVHKFLDLNNIRGVIMAEVGHIDLQLSIIARSFFTNLCDEKKNKLICKYMNKVMDQNNANSKKISNLEGSLDIDKLLENLDSKKKWNICQSLSNKVDALNIPKSDDYEKDVLQPRNFLAHGTPQPQEDGSLLFTHFGKKYVFDDEASISLRKKLQYYIDRFDEIITSYQQG